MEIPGKKPESEEQIKAWWPGVVAWWYFLSQQDSDVGGAEPGRRIIKETAGSSQSLLTALLNITSSLTSPRHQERKIFGKNNVKHLLLLLPLRVNCY